MDVGKLLNDEEAEESVENDGARQAGPSRGNQSGAPGGSGSEGKEFFCDTCLSAFATKANLKVHVQTVHMGLRPYVCEMCGRSFGTNSSMRRHQKILHQSERPYTCTVCSKRFATRSCIRRHYVKVHTYTRDVADQLITSSCVNNPSSPPLK